MNSSQGASAPMKIMTTGAETLDPSFHNITLLPCPDVTNQKRDALCEDIIIN